MIRYLKRKDIDIAKYNTCIEVAINSRIYAYSWYLDIVASNWDALVLNDYEAVMPLPWRQKYFIKYIYPPAWTQQLGVFSSFKMEADLVKQFVNSIPKKFKKITIQFNSGNDMSFFKTEARMNYILPLNKTYEEIYKGYRKDRRKRLSKISKIDLKIYDIVSFEEIKKEFIRCYVDKMNVNNVDFQVLENLFNILKKKEVLVLKSVRINEEFVSGLILLKDIKRITVLFSATTELGLKSNSFSAIMDQVINENAKTDFTLDFEGSMIKSIASFNKSFGAVEEVYFLYKKYKLF